MLVITACTPPSIACSTFSTPLMKLLGEVKFTRELILKNPFPNKGLPEDAVELSTFPNILNSSWGLPDPP